MYNRVGQTLFAVGRRLTRKLCNNGRNNDISSSYRASNVNLKSTTNHLIFQRNYCDDSCKETSKDVPVLLSPDEEASIKLKEFLASPENERVHKIIELEVEVLRQNNERVPNVLRPRHWFELVRLDSRSKRKRYLDFVWSLERKKENLLETKKEKRKVYEEKLATKMLPKIGQNSMFLRIYETTMNHMYNGRLMNAMLYGQPIVMDCSYEPHMTRREIKYCARQLKLSFATNRIHDNPFNMYFCNADLSGEMMKFMHRFIPTLYDTEFPLNIQTESYLDTFDKNRLVYLTPHCHQEMKEFDHDAVYIIGAFVDKTSHAPISLAKAKKEGLKMAKLPLSRYLQWGSSAGKNLTLNAVLNILLDLRLTGSWEKALEHVPRRKLYEYQNENNRYLQNKLEDEPSTEAQDRIMPLQVPRAKFTQRYNRDPESYSTSRSNDRSNYQQKFRSNYEDTSKGEEDFSITGRKKVKKNWKI